MENLKGSTGLCVFLWEADTPRTRAEWCFAAFERKFGELVEADRLAASIEGFSTAIGLRYRQRGETVLSGSNRTLKPCTVPEPVDRECETVGNKLYRFEPVEFPTRVDDILIQFARMAESSLKGSCVPLCQETAIKVISVLRTDIGQGHVNLVHYGFAVDLQAFYGDEVHPSYPLIFACRLTQPAVVVESGFAAPFPILANRCMVSRSVRALPRRTAYRCRSSVRSGPFCAISTAKSHSASAFTAERLPVSRKGGRA